ncbi:ATP-binding protein [Xylophilus rhododendri]|uniref:ATP-binding protein n=1 Tax=Xylophilus rhododendri TaxID=2697032 RepID=A0A857J136_9BURK|nr:ATP-binding protein [Xylophilus rhododendri]QHI97590.1 ATP-binding protein [Xylophilus rhododendri]
MADTPIFPRPGLASQLAAQILHQSPTSSSPSGVFLAAPRRTGKSTFVREDLRPALQAKGAVVIYVDLWADRHVDPSELLAVAIRTEMGRHGHAVQKIAKGLGISGGKVAGLEFSLDRIGIGKDVTLVQALAVLSDEVKQPMVLVIDEAQHALTSQAGMDSLFALKAARDELNSSAHHGLRLVCTGSNRDKLAMLRSSKDQAFYGAPLVAFPHLDKDYVAWFCEHVGLSAELAPEAVWALFEKAGWRPELLGAAADSLRFDFQIQPADVQERFSAAVAEQIDAAACETLRVVHALTPLQTAVLRVLADSGTQYRPFEAATLEKYREALSAAGESAESAPRVDVTAVQAALQALQDKSLVWRAARGVYALEDVSLREVLAA